MTGAGVTLYLVLAMNNYILAALTAGVFAPLIGFHFLITLISKRDDLLRIEDFRKLGHQRQDSKKDDYTKDLKGSHNSTAAIAD
jgi:hypothetical protein